MSGRVVLHIGAMKTGTSFLQSVLQQREHELAAVGVEFLGGRFGVQTRAVLEGLNPPRDPARNSHRWRHLVSAASDDRVSIVSMEFLSFAGPKQVRSLLDPLAGRHVEVVLTVRDQLRVVAPQWQSHVRNFGTASWEEYLREIRPTRAGGRQRSRASRTFHRAQDIQQIVDTWASQPHVSRFTVVTVPPPDAARDELWKRFCAAAGVPAVDLPEVVKENQSLGYASCDLLRRVNALLGDVPPARYRRIVRPVCRRVLAPLRATEGRPVLDREAAEHALSRNDQVRELVERASLGVVGSLDDLPTARTFDHHPDVVEPPPRDDVVRAARAVLEHFGKGDARSGTRSAVDLDELVSTAGRELRRAALTDR